MPTTGEISLYVDAMLVETVLADPKLYKKGGFITDLLTKVKDYFAEKIDPNNPVKSVLNMLAPGVLWVVFKGLGLGMWGTLIGLLMNVFHVDAYGMMVSLYEKVKDMISGGQKVSSSQIDSAVNGIVQSHSQVNGEQEAQEAYQKLQQKQQQPAQANDGKVYSSLELLHDAKIIRLAMVEYERQNLRLVKEAISLSEFTPFYSSRKAKGTSLLGSILGFVFKLALASAGLMVAGDIVRKIFHMDDRGSGGASSETPSGTTSTQTKYHASGDTPLPHEMPIANNRSNIENMVVQFAKDVYPDLSSKEDIIRSSPYFKAVVDQIAHTNLYNPGSAETLIPSIFHSKKQVVDYFIDDVAKRDTA